jgi:nucleotide-binding universal stress UspA family protein
VREDVELEKTNYSGVPFMEMLKSILLATDFRSVNEDTLDAVAHLALVFGSQVSLLHVTQDIPLAIQQLGERAIDTSLLQPALQHLAEKHVAIGQSSIKFGPVANTIIDIAQEWDVDLIVIGAGEIVKPNGFLISATAEAVIAQAPQPVLVVQPGNPPLQFKKILCPVNQSNTSARGLRNAIRLAKVCGGEIIVLTVIPEVSWLTAAVETGEFVDAKAEHAAQWVQEFERFLTDIDFSGVAWKREIRDGAPHEQIAAAAKEHEVDLIMMGATGRSGLVRVLLGSTTRRLLYELPCSLLTIKQENMLEDLFETDLRSIELLAAEAQKLSAACAPRRHDKIGETWEANGYRRRSARLRHGAESRAVSKRVSNNSNEYPAGQS